MTRQKNEEARRLFEKVNNKQALTVMMPELQQTHSVIHPRKLTGEVGPFEMIKAGSAILCSV